MSKTNGRKSNVPVQLGVFPSTLKNHSIGLRQAKCRSVYSRGFLTSKKAQSISINTIIIAAIGLAVLVVLFVVFTGRFSKFGEGVRESSLTCEKGCKTVGYAQGFSRGGGGAGETQIPGRFEDTKEGETCWCS